MTILKQFTNIDFHISTAFLISLYHKTFYFSTFIIKMLFATAKSYLTSYLFPFTYYFPKNPAISGKSEEVRGKK